MTTGAIIAGRRTFEPAGRWNGDHHDGCRSTSSPTAPTTVTPPAGTVVHTDAASCATAARVATDSPVMVHGAKAGQALIEAGRLDEMEIHLVPVLLGQGRRLFEARGHDHVEWELVRSLRGHAAVHLRYRLRP